MHLWYLRVIDGLRGWGGGVIGCQQLCVVMLSGGRVVVGCRRMLSVWDRAAIMVGLEAGLSGQVLWGGVIVLCPSGWVMH